jgi:hypothetical protein
MTEHGLKPSDRRDVIRCFGSLLDGLTACMRFAAVKLCQVFDEPLNPFLRDKTAERDLNTHNRIYSILGISMRSHHCRIRPVRSR